jgi:cobalamin biosynthesis protein CbiM
MHIPDGFLTTPVWASFDVLAASSVALVARRAQADFEERSIPLMGVMGAFVFAAQMINFPVGPGTSGHLVGGTLLAIALGPSAAMIVMTAILAIQALVFQDGGILALGANVFNMAIAGVLAGYLPYRLLRNSAGIFLGGVASVLASAVFALAELSISRVPFTPRVMNLTLLFFGVGAILEGAITLAAVRAIERMNAARFERDRTVADRALVGVAAIAIVLAVAGIFVASTSPDGIEILGKAHSPEWLHSPFADYEAHGINSPWLRKSAAGFAGLGLIFLVSVVLGRTISKGTTGGQHLILERWSRGSSAIHSLDARAKLVGLLAFLIAVATTPAHSQIAFLAYAVTLAIAVSIARLPAGALLLRALLVLPFSATFALITWLSGDPWRAAALGEKSFLSGFAALLVIATTPLTDLARGLESFYVPRPLILVIQFVYRYVFVIAEQADHMRLAARSRGSSFRASAGALAVLFSRSWERADGVYRAMSARGFNGKFPTLHSSRFRPADAGFILAIVAISLAIRLAA